MPKRQLRSIQTTIFMYFFILIIVIVLILDSFFIYQMRNTVERDAHVYAYEIVKQAGRNMDYYIRHMEDIALILERDTEIKNYFLKENIEYQEKTHVYPEQKLEKFKTMSSTKSDIVSIFVFGENDLVLADDAYRVKDYVNIKDMNWYKEAIEAKGLPVVSSAHIQNYLEGNPKWVFSVSAAIMDHENNVPLGVILIDMNYETISDICSQIQLGKRGYVYIANDTGEIIYHPKQQLIYSKLETEDLLGILKQKEGSYISKLDKRLITVHTLPEIGWKVVGVSYLPDLLVSQRELVIAVVAFTLCCLILAFIVSRIIAKDISRPIQELQDAMLQVEKGNMDVIVEGKSNAQEVVRLSQTFQTMVRRMKNLLEEIHQNQRKLRKTELKVLQAQINPHFLYNALDTIIWLGERGEYERVVLMTSALAKYFRLSLSKGYDIIPIMEEIEHVKNYLVIQKIRYDNKLNYQFDIDSEILGYLTVKIILQPLVENALYHGIKDRDEGGSIRIIGRKIGDVICLIVEDNGVGMTKRQVENILKSNISTSITGSGVAIKNVHERIQIYFGREYGLKYKSELGKGTKVYIYIPIKEELSFNNFR